jgi:hypothetical protein
MRRLMESEGEVVRMCVVRGGVQAVLENGMIILNGMMMIG